jgi:hypothetical protein
MFSAPILHSLGIDSLIRANHAIDGMASPLPCQLTNAYTKKNIQTTSRINMAPINNGGHTRWRIFATALRTTVKSDWRPCNLIRADRSVTFYRANRPICPKNIARVGGA